MRLAGALPAHRCGVCPAAVVCLQIAHRPTINKKAQPCGLGHVLAFNGAGGRNRTADLLITNELLYQLSYAGLQPKSISAGGKGTDQLGRASV